MAITSKNAKILWANAAGRCAFPNCGVRLTGSTDGGHYTLGQMAHIKGENPGSNRHDPLLLEPELSAYPNLVLMCAHHHSEIDRPENEGLYSVEVLQRLKTAHEAFIDNIFAAVVFNSKEELAKAVFPLLVESHAIFNQYGPHSDLAKQNPMSDEIYQLWEEERLSTIVPNNRRILKAVEENIGLFNPHDVRLIQQYKLHVCSYERWVKSESSYQGVVRFPIAFSDLIEELANAGA